MPPETPCPREERLPGGTLVYTTKAFPITTDSLLLARFCEVRPRWALCDLGSGGGILLLALVDRGLAGPAVGVEVQPEGAELLRAAAADGGLGGVRAECADLRCWRSAQLFDLAVANPPYFTSGMPSPNSARAQARHQGDATLADFCAAAGRVLKDGAHFCLCYPAGQLAELFAVLRQSRLEPKRLQLVRKAPEAGPWLALVEARKAAGVGLAIMPEQIVQPGNSIRY